MNLAPRTRTAPLVDTPSLLAPSASGLAVASRLNLVTRRIPDRSSSPYWEPVRAGMGAYAEVFRVDEWVHNDAGLLARTPLMRSIVAKVFRDSAPNDWESVYTGELQTLLALGPHDRLVGLRGAVDQMPPTFVCGHINCGKAFQVDLCPQCGQKLRNHDLAEALLMCDQGHRFQKYNHEQARALTMRRPCAHVDDCVCVNFLFRPYIFLEQLDLDLRALNEQLTTLPQPDALEPVLAFESKAETDERRREVLLLRVNVLIGIAEGIFFMHERGCLHADIAPENTMVRLSPPSDGKTFAAASASAKLIDFGLAKRVEDNRTSTTVVGRITFLAPEQMVAQGALGPKVTIRFRDGVAKEGDLCRICMLSGDDLPFERRDFVRDVEDGQYEILADNDVPAEWSGLPAATYTNQDSRPSMYARVLKPPVTGTDAAQTTLRFSYALDIPTDIFSLGCLIGWNVTGGQESLVHLVREQANVATRRRQILNGDFANRLLGEDYRKLCNAIDLPSSAQDDAIKTALIDVMCRCLIRSEGGYCRQRSSGYNRPAASVVADLRRIRNTLFLLTTSPTEVAGIARRHIEEEAARIDAFKQRVDHLEREAADADTTLRLREEELGVLNQAHDRSSRRAFLWRTTTLATTLGFMAMLGAAMPWGEPKPAPPTVKQSALPRTLASYTPNEEPQPQQPQVPEPITDPITEPTPAPTELSLSPTDEPPAKPVIEKREMKEARPLRMVQLPNLEGQHVDTAEERLRGLGLSVVVQGTGNEVLTQSAYGSVRSNATITLIVASEEVPPPLLQKSSPAPRKTPPEIADPILTTVPKQTEQSQG